MVLLNVEGMHLMSSLSQLQLFVQIAAIWLKDLKWKAVSSYLAQTPVTVGSTVYAQRKILQYHML